MVGILNLFGLKVIVVVEMGLVMIGIFVWKVFGGFMDESIESDIACCDGLHDAMVEV